MQNLISKLSNYVTPFQNTLEPEDEEHLLSAIVPSWAEVVLLGESTHGTEEFYQFRRKLCRHLIRDRGFRVVLVEAEWPDVYMVNEYITTLSSTFASGKAALAQIKGHGKHMWQNESTVEMVEWMKQFNKSQAYRPDSMVYLFGIDCQQLYRSLSSIYSVLAELDFSLFSELRAKFSFFNGYSEDERIYVEKTIRQIGSEQIPEILASILSEFQWKHFDRLKSNLPSHKMLDLMNVEQNLEVIVNGEEYYRKSALEPSGSQVSWNTRDQHMALTVNRIRERLKLVTHPNDPEAPFSKVIVWAHNSHIGNAAATSRGGSDFTRNETWNLGQMVKHIVSPTFLLGFDTFQGEVTALKRGTDYETGTFTLIPALELSSEHICHQVCLKLNCDAFILDLLKWSASSLNNMDLIQNGPIPGDYTVLHSDLPVYSTKESKEPSSGHTISKGSRFRAVERFINKDTSRLRLEQGGWISELLPYRSIQIQVRPVDFYHEDSNVETLLRSRMPQRYVGVHYEPETELQSHYSEGSLIGQYDGLVFIDQTHALKVLSSQELESESNKSTSKAVKLKSKQGVRRLIQEYRQLRKFPVPNIRIAAEEDNLYICHFLLLFDSGIYSGGEYHGKLEIPPDYPMAPPRIIMLTPSGRFQTNTRICVSFSDYHPELWNPSWGIESVLVGLQSFMQDESPDSLGSIHASSSERKKLASLSHEFNTKDEAYCQLFQRETADYESDEAEDKDQPFCRYCRVTGGELVSPCECKGGNQFVHLECLAKWQYQAILSQSTHPAYQTGVEKICNVCQTEFKIKQFSRESLVLTFTGQEIAGMIQTGCLLIATEKSSQHNLRLIEQYGNEDRSLKSSLSHWTRSVFLVVRVITRHGGDKDCILGFSLTNTRQDPSALSRLMSKDIKKFEKLGLQDCQHFVGGPVDEWTPFLIMSLKISSINNPDSLLKQPGFYRVANFADKDTSIWYLEEEETLPQLLPLIKNALVEARVYWGYAAWNRVQLLGEIARGAWGLSTFKLTAWTAPPNICWEQEVASAVIAGRNDLSLY